MKPCLVYEQIRVEQRISTTELKRK